MITLVENNELDAVYAFCEDNLLGTKIACQVRAYGLERDFLYLWCCKENDVMTALICKFENSITYFMKDCRCADEIRSFTEMLGCDSICGYKEDCLAVGFDDFTVKKGYVYKGRSFCESAENLTEKHYRQSYNLISRCIPDSFDSSENGYLSFLSDFTFRQRRSLARIKGVLQNDEVISCALTSAETDTSAIISGVACKPDARQKGLGKNTVLSLSCELTSENKKVYVIALNESAEGFYEHIGFEYKNDIAFIERK